MAPSSSSSAATTSVQVGEFNAQKSLEALIDPYQLFVYVPLQLRTQLQFLLVFNVLLSLQLL